MAVHDIDDLFESGPPRIPPGVRGNQPGRGPNYPGKDLRAPKGIQVVRFHVWQDLTVGAEKDSAPLHVTVTFEMANEWYAALSQPDGRIRIQGLRGNETIQANLVVHQAHYGLGLTQPGSRQLQFVMSPTQRCPRQHDNQMVRGSVRMKFGRRSVRIDLPATKLIFTR
jgi:hypothetical protein